MDQQRVVMITGAAGNLGRAVADAFAGDGTVTVLVDRSTERLRSRYGEPSPQRRYVAADLLQPDEIQRAVDATCDALGRINVLCHLAGAFRMGEAVHETSAATWDGLFDLNARTLMHLAHALVPRMIEQGGGRIVTVGAQAALRGGAAMGAYAASKSAVIRLSEAMAAELRDRGINVNCVLPSIIDTPENRQAMPAADPSRWVAPADLAAVIVFLASDAARAIHGAAVPVVGLS